MLDKPIIEWNNLYKERWNDLISPSAISHPAKFSHGLIRRIYEYALERGYITPDSKVLDPFGGVGLGAFYAVNSGLVWLGNELEDKFYLDAYKNFALWCERFWCVCDDPEYLFLLRQYATPKLEESPQLTLFSQDETNLDDLLEQIKAHAFASWDRENKGQWCEKCGKMIVAYPVLLKGDSRLLSSIIAEQVDGSISSPPFIDQVPQQDKSFKMPHDSTGNVKGDYGTTENQLGNLPPGDLDSIVGSPPFMDITSDRPSKNIVAGGLKMGASSMGDGYGTSDGQLGSLKEGSLDALLSSPPYANSLDSEKSGIDPSKFKQPHGKTTQALRPTQYGKENGQLGTMKDEGFDVSIGSPPFASTMPGSESINFDTRPDGTSFGAGKSMQVDGYGKESGNLGNLPDKGFDLSISSPSFAGNTGGRGEASRNGIDPALFDRSSGGMKHGTGDSEDNLDHLPMKGFDEVMDASIGSPPFEASTANMPNKPEFYEHPTQKDVSKYITNKSIGIGYGSSENQLGNSTGPTFWSAAREILGQCWLLLKPGAYSFWVCKNYVKNSQIVPFIDQWQILCEVCGFEHVETIIAWQIEHKPGQYDTEGNLKAKIIRRQSFFRLLAIKNNPETAIDYEAVLVMRKL